MGSDCPTHTSLTPGHGKGIPVIFKDSATVLIRITSYKGRTPTHCLVLVSFPIPSVLTLQPKHTLTIPQNKIVFGSAASWGLGKGRDHLLLTCNCSVSPVTALGCREIPMQVCCGKFPAMTTFCRVLPTLLLLSLCSQHAVMHSTSN